MVDALHIDLPDWHKRSDDPKRRDLQLCIDEKTRGGLAEVYSVNVFLCKALKRLGIISYVNMSLRLGTVRVPVLGGVGIEHLLYQHESWLAPLIRMLLGSRSGAFVDVGVNLGQTLIKVISCDRGREYYGFEPNACCYAYVRRLKEVNNLNHVCLIPVGLSNRIHMGQLFSDGLTDSSATTVKGFRGIETDENSQPVPLFKGDDLLPHMLDVAIIKIDVEGGELEVLQGLRETLQRCRPFVVCEILPIYDESTERGRMRRARTDELLSLFESLDYKTARLLHDGNIVPLVTIETHRDLDRCEYLFYPSEMEPGTWERRLTKT